MIPPKGVVMDRYLPTEPPPKLETAERCATGTPMIVSQSLPSCGDSSLGRGKLVRGGASWFFSFLFFFSRVDINPPSCDLHITVGAWWGSLRFRTDVTGQLAP